MELEMQPAPAFLTGQSHNREAWRAVAHSIAESDMTEQLNTHACTPNGRAPMGTRQRIQQHRKPCKGPNRPQYQQPQAHVRSLFLHPRLTSALHALFYNAAPNMLSTLAHTIAPVGLTQPDTLPSASGGVSVPLEPSSPRIKPQGRRSEWAAKPSFGEGWPDSTRSVGGLAWGH